MKILAKDVNVRLCIIAFFCFTLIPAHAVLLVVPNGNAEVLGVAASSAPFGFDLELCRVQQAHDSSQFSFLGTNGGYINKVSFRLGLSPGYFRPPSGVIHMLLTINMSTTSNSLSKLSTVFDQNTGTDKTTVYSGTYNLSSLTGCGVVEPFGVVIPLSTPFFYNPTNGPLLVEMIAGITDEYATGLACMDAIPSTGNGISSVWHANGPNDPTMPTNGSLNAYSIVTQFDISSATPALPLLTIVPLSTTNIILTVTNGSPGTLFSLLRTTNLSSSPSGWISIRDSAIGQAGTYCLTNTINTNAAQYFYRLQIH